MADENNQEKVLPPMQIIRDEGETKRGAWIREETQRPAAWRETNTVLDPKAFKPLQPK
jgi:hypothetical protein